MSQSGNQYVYTIEKNGTLTNVFKNRRSMKRAIASIIEHHRADGWEIVQDHTIPEVYLNLRAKGVSNGIYRNLLLTFTKYNQALRAQFLVKCWVIKSERIT
jgi:hypothetical protein